MSKRDDSPKTFVYEEPSYLDMPPPQDGYVYRWLRISILGDRGYEDDIKNISLREREGYVFVNADELPDDWQGKIPVHESGRYKGVVGHGDVALAKIEEGRAKARQEFYERKAQDMEHAINVQLGRESAKRPDMPIYNDSKSKVTTGSRAANFDD